MSEPKKTALLLVDVINTFDFERGELLLEQAERNLDPLRDLIDRARRAGAPIIYANDNYGRWQDTFADVVTRCTGEDFPGRHLAEALQPRGGEHFILKPKHSAFYLTSLDALLPQLGVERLVLAGYAGDICVLFTANDAHMREYEVVVPCDCVASETRDGTDCALEMLRQNLSVKTPKGAEVRFLEPQ